ncbi:hypothetical protein C2I19_04715 [Chromobacterium alticapitis]|uniref:Pyoverdine/dityrosine biosynthesis protein n=1 Tax=Chromobacterium alticapitis TaxID=2073169 RepID=A0A2S5DJ35_9NEIS|nr:hypothetical protein C2I19_04715 [Chromobacterium alticapitis]
MITLSPPPRRASGETDAPPQLNEEQRRSQISSGHRLIRLVRQKRFHLYSKAEFHTRAVRLPADYWLHHFVPALRAGMNETMAQRLSAAVARARRNAGLYGVAKPDVAEFIAEAFFDNWWFKAKEDNMSRVTLRDRVRELIAQGKPIRLHLPILSRKPFSPVKNRGPLPDLAELHTLARCAEAAQVIHALSPTGCQFVILADGFKYNRACRTPDAFVAAYQDGLRYWIEQLGIGDIVKLENYEQWVTAGIPAALAEERTRRYQTHCLALEERYGEHFDADELDEGMAALERLDDVGGQLSFTFWSVVGSVYYEELFALAETDSFADRHYGDEVQQLYIAYLSSLHRNLAEYRFQGLHLPMLGYFPPERTRELFRALRRRAWEAAIRYVAISLTDRDLDVVRRIDGDAIKLTIHGKKGEVHFLSATKQDVNMTAQHCCGGVAASAEGAKLTFRYRLERESLGEVPVLIERLPDTAFYREKYGALHALQKLDQPICYASAAELAGNGLMHTLLLRKG